MSDEFELDDKKVAEKELIGYCAFYCSDCEEICKLEDVVSYGTEDIGYPLTDDGEPDYGNPIMSIGGGYREDRKLHRNCLKEVSMISEETREDLKKRLVEEVL